MPAASGVHRRSISVTRPGRPPSAGLVSAGSAVCERRGAGGQWRDRIEAAAAWRAGLWAAGGGSVRIGCRNSAILSALSGFSVYRILHG